MDRREDRRGRPTCILDTRHERAKLTPHGYTGFRRPPASRRALRLMGGRHGEPHPVGAHDVGGRPAPRVDKDEHPHALWEYRVDALMVLLTAPARKLLTTDELRRHVEGLGPGAYETMGYYERWCAAITAAMIERGVVTSDELGRRMTEVAARSR